MVDEHSLPPPPPQPLNKSEAYSLSSESTSSDVDGDRQQLKAAKSGGTDDVDDDADDMDDTDDDIDGLPVTAAMAAATADADADTDDDGCASVVADAAADVSRPLSADMYFMARRSVVILVSFSLCASTARCGTARRSASNASLISRIRLRSRALAVFLRYLRIAGTRYSFYLFTELIQ